MPRQRYTPEQREFIVGYGDYPVWVIVDAYKTRFPGAPMPSTAHIMNLRRAARGTSNRHRWRAE